MLQWEISTAKKSKGVVKISSKNKMVAKIKTRN